MRVTNTSLTKKQADWVKNTTEERDKAINPKTKKPVSVDFSKDLFSLLDTLTPHKALKNLFEIDDEVVKEYIKKRLTNYVNVREHYSAINRFLRKFTTTRLYQQLQGINNPEKALEILLDMFSPKPPPQTQQAGGGGSEQKNQKQDTQNQPQGQNNKQENQEQKNSQPQEQKQKEQSQEQKTQDQPQKQETENQSQKQEKNQTQEQEKMDNTSESEISNNPPPPLLDIKKFSNEMPTIEKTLENNPFDDEIMRKILEKGAGLKHNALSTIEGLAENIKKISAFVGAQKFKILDVARKIGATEQYAREEKKSDVIYPEKDWRITNMKNISDLPKILPYQHLYPQDIFDKLLLDKDLKIKQYQSRKKKKQVLYLLIDGSGSMNTDRQTTAAGIAIAYIKKAIQEGSIYFFRFFDTSVFDLHQVTNEQEAIKEINCLLNNPHSDGGTSIDKAIRHTMQDINNPALFKQNTKEKNNLYDRADILIITDGEDTVSITKKELEKQRIVLHSFLLGNRPNETLESISHTYQNLTDNKLHSLCN